MKQIFTIIFETNESYKESLEKLGSKEKMREYANETGQMFADVLNLITNRTSQMSGHDYSGGRFYVTDAHFVEED